MGSLRQDQAQMGGFTVDLTVVPVVSASPDYTSGDVMGAKTEIVNAGRLSSTDASGQSVNSRGVIMSVVISDKAEQSLDIDVLFFKAEPSTGTYTDNGAFALDDADALLCIGVAHVTDWTDGGSGSDIGFDSNLGFAFDLGAANASLWIIVVARGAHNLGSTSDFQIRVGILAD